MHRTTTNTATTDNVTISIVMTSFHCAPAALFIFHPILLFILISFFLSPSPPPFSHPARLFIHSFLNFLFPGHLSLSLFLPSLPFFLSYYLSAFLYSSLLFLILLKESLLFSTSTLLQLILSNLSSSDSPPHNPIPFCRNLFHSI